MIGSWHILSGEYPPQAGGVSDYSFAVATALSAAGERVHVWAPPCENTPAGMPGAPRVHRLPDTFGPRGLRELTRGIDAAPAPRVVLVQYVPHSFGMRAMNVPFCAWLATRRHDRVLVMFHEIAVGSGGPRAVRRMVLAFAQRAMATLAAHAADVAFVSVPAWDDVLRRIVPRAPATSWLPVPSNVATRVDPRDVRTVRDRVGGDGVVVLGHFGTYGSVITTLLEPALASLLQRDRRRVALLVGRGSAEFAAQMASREPELQGRIIAAGALDPVTLAAHLRACDVLVQPYPDGVTSRRGTTMAGLALGCPVVTNDGALTESIWRDAGAVALARAPDVNAIVESAEALLADPAARVSIGERAAAVYAARFSLEHVVERLLEAGQRGPI